MLARLRIRFRFDMRAASCREATLELPSALASLLYYTRTHADTHACTHTHAQARTHIQPELLPALASMRYALAISYPYIFQ